MSSVQQSRNERAAPTGRGDGNSTAWADLDQPGSEPAGAIPASLRRPIEQTYGVDLSGTRIHTDTPAAESADALSAHAYTVGPDIFFAAGAFAPGTRQGDQLLAHELAHVAQGAAGPAAKAISSEPGDAAEVEADRAAELAVANIYDGAQHQIQLSATPTATHMRKAKPTQKRSMEDEVARRQALVLSMAQFPDRPGPDSAFANFMASEGQASELNKLDREYPMLSGMLPLVHSSCDRVNVIEYESGLTAGGASEAESFFSAAAKAAKGDGDLKSAAEGLRTEKTGLTDLVEGTGVSGDDGYIGCMLAVRAAQSDLEVALNTAKKEVLEEKREALQNQMAAITARYNSIIDGLILCSKITSLIDDFAVGDAAELAKDNDVGGKLAASSDAYKALSSKLEAVNGSLNDVRYNTIKETINSAEDRLAKAIKSLEQRRSAIARKKKPFRAEYKMIGEKLDAAKVKGGPQTNDELKEGHGQQIMMLIAAIRERAVMGRQLQGYWDNSKRLKDLEWQEMYQSKFSVATSLSHVSRDGSLDQNRACIRHLNDVKLLVGNIDYWLTQETEWLAVLQKLTGGEVRDY